MPGASTDCSWVAPQALVVSALTLSPVHRVIKHTLSRSKRWKRRPILRINAIQLKEGRIKEYTMLGYTMLQGKQMMLNADISNQPFLVHNKSVESADVCMASSRYSKCWPFHTSGGEALLSQTSMSWQYSRPSSWLWTAIRQHDD
jgi:hypothetical protein